MLDGNKDVFVMKISKTNVMVMLAALALFWLSWLSVSTGMAQTTPAPAPATGGVDFSPLAMQVITIASLALTAIAGWLAKFAVGWLASKTRINDSEAERLLADRVGDILNKSVDYAESWAKAQVADPVSPLKHVQIDNFFVAQATKYAMNSMPDLIKYFGLTENRINDMVRARLAPIMGDPKADSGSVPHVLSDGNGITVDELAVGKAA
jgi:hypothetical protein